VKLLSQEVKWGE